VGSTHEVMGLCKLVDKKFYKFKNEVGSIKVLEQEMMALQHSSVRKSLL